MKEKVALSRGGGGGGVGWWDEAVKKEIRELKQQRF